MQREKVPHCRTQECHRTWVTKNRFWLHLKILYVVCHTCKRLFRLIIFLLLPYAYATVKSYFTAMCYCCWCAKDSGVTDHPLLDCPKAQLIFGFYTDISSCKKYTLWLLKKKKKEQKSHGIIFHITCWSVFWTRFFNIVAGLHHLILLFQQ